MNKMYSYENEVRREKWLLQNSSTEKVVLAEK